MAELKIWTPHKKPYTFPLIQEEISIGRSSDNDLIISDPLLSRKHATILQRGEEYFIKDNKSKNGTFLNGVKITKEEPLKDKNKIKIGQTIIQFFAAEEEREEEKFSEEGEIFEETSSTQIFPLKNLLTQYERGIKAVSEEEESFLLQWQNKALMTLKDLSLELLTHRPLRELLEQIMDLAGRIIPARRGALMLKEGEKAKLYSNVIRYYQGKPSSKPIKISRSIINSVLQNQASLLTVDAQMDDRFSSKESIIAENVHSAICLPLWNNKEVIGLIYMDRGLGEKPFNKEELYLMSSLANMAAIKIENTKLFEEALEKKALEEQLSLAAEIQRSLLPRQCPCIGGLDIAASHIPCSYVGGDYYDFFSLSEDRLGIAIADVSGKGPAGALLMATLRAALASQIRLKISLRELAFYLNNFIYQSSANNKYITFFYGEIDYEGGMLNYINAGHNPPRIITKGKKVIDLPAGGLSLGFFPDRSYEEDKAKLNKGDILLLFTDGVSERTNLAGEEFGEGKLVNLIKKNQKLDAQKLLDLIFDETEEFASQSAQEDDMTLVIVKKI